MWIQSKGDATIPQLAGVVDDFIAKAKQRPELAQRHLDVQCVVAAVARQRGPRQGGDARRADRGSVQRDADHVRLAVRLAVQPVEPAVAGDPAGRAVVPAEAARTSIRSSCAARPADMVPLKAVVTTKYVTGPDLVTRFNNFPAVKITANAAPGYSSGQVIAALEEVADEVMPTDYGIAGAARRTRRRGGRHLGAGVRVRPDHGVPDPRRAV